MSDLKILRVCLSKDLPLLNNRDPNIIYFLYDKLTVFLGQSLYNDPYAIVESMPKDPVNGMLYFTLDGYVKAYINYSIETIAKIENNEQLELLKQAGTIFFVNAEKRYLDLQRRIITLPFQNGTYELTVSVGNDSSGYKGKDTSTAAVKVDNQSISADIKVSPAYNNILRYIKDGLYANVDDRVTQKEFESWKSSFLQYKTDMEYYLKDLEDQIYDSQGVVSDESINKRIHDALVKVYPEIDHMIESYDKISEEMTKLEERCMGYSDTKLNSARDDLNNAILDATNNPWEVFGM